LSRTKSTGALLLHPAGGDHCAAARIGLADWFNAIRVPLTDMLTCIRKPWPEVMLRLLETFSGAPLLSSIADRYFGRYGSVYSMRPSEQVRRLHFEAKTGRKVETTHAWVRSNLFFCKGDSKWRAIYR